MSSIQLDANGDIVLTGNRMTLTTGKEAIRQHMVVRFYFFFGEWFLDKTLGVPWYQEILVKRNTFVVVADILKGVILATPGVTELLEFSFDYDSVARHFTLEFSCDTVDGVIDFTLAVNVG